MRLRLMPFLVCLALVAAGCTQPPETPHGGEETPIEPAPPVPPAPGGEAGSEPTNNATATVAVADEVPTVRLGNCAIIHASSLIPMDEAMPFMPPGFTPNGGILRAGDDGTATMRLWGLECDDGMLGIASISVRVPETRNALGNGFNEVVIHSVHGSSEAMQPWLETWDQPASVGVVSATRGALPELVIESAEMPITFQGVGGIFGESPSDLVGARFFSESAHVDLLWNQSRESFAIGPATHTIEGIAEPTNGWLGYAGRADGVWLSFHAP